MIRRTFSDEYENALKNIPTKCTTNDSVKDKNKSCQFPFQHKKKIYTECTKDGSKDGVPWCATKVNKKLRYKKGKWGNCNLKTCPSLNRGTDSDLWSGKFIIMG